MLGRVALVLVLGWAGHAIAASVEIDLRGDRVEARLAESPRAQALAALAERAGFTVQGAEYLPTEPMSARLRGPVDDVLETLTAPANRVMSRDAAGRLIRLVILPSPGQPRPAPLVIAADSLAVDDPAVGASRVPPAAARGAMVNSLGIAPKP